MSMGSGDPAVKQVQTPAELPTDFKKPPSAAPDLHPNNTPTPQSPSAPKATEEQDGSKPSPSSKRSPRTPKGVLKAAFNDLKDTLIDVKNIILTDKSQVLIDEAETSTNHIRADILRFQDAIIQTAVPDKLLWLLLDRLLDKIANKWNVSVHSLMPLVKELYDQGKLKQQPEDMEMRKAEEVEKMKDWIEVFQELSSNDTVKQMDHQHLKAHLRCILDHLKEGLNLAEQKAVEHSIGITVNDIRINVEKLTNISQKDCYTVIIVGLEDSGKSTFTNVLLGVDLLPRAEGRCTMLTTVIRGSSTPGTRVQLEFCSPEEFAADLEEFTASRQDGDPTIEEVEEAYRQLNQRQLLINGSPSEMKEELEKYIGNRRLVYSVKKIIIETDVLQFRIPVEIMDLPGYDSTIEDHRVMAMNAIKVADSFILPTSGYQPELTQPATKLVDDLVTWGVLTNKGFGYISKLDRCIGSASVQKCLAKAKQQLMIKAKIPEKRIFAGCSIYNVLMNKDDRSADEENTLKELTRLLKSDDYAFLKDGALDARDAILDYLESELPMSRMKDAQEFGEILVGRMKSLISRLDVDDTNLKPDTNAKWSKYFNSLMGESKKIANVWRWENITNRQEFFSQLIASFVEDLKKNLKNDDADAYDLARQVPEYTARIGLVPIHIIEGLERERLFRVHLDRVQKSLELIGFQLYQKLDEFCMCLLDSFGLPDYDKQVQEIFHVDRIIRRDVCVAQVESLVMRSAYPAAAAFIQWSQNTKIREEARKDLEKACPEFVVKK